MVLESKSKIKLVYFLIIIGAVIIIGRLYHLQIVENEYYKNKSITQLESPTNQIFNRGVIFFTEKDDKTISAANLNEGFTLSINPSVLENAESVYNKINSIFPLNKEDFLEKAQQNNQYAKLENRLPQDIADKIKNLEITGVNLTSEKWRYYPTGDLASQTIGFVGFNGNKLEGRYGLERYYEETLKREEKPNFAKFFSEIFSEAVGKEDSPEGDIITSIEPTVQSNLKAELEKALERWSGKNAGGIVMDPKTGEIIAISKTPGFNPNEYNKVNDISIFGNPLIENVFEMGSIIKPLTVAVGLDSETIDLNFKYNDYGKLEVDDRTIYNYDFRGRGKNTPLQQILSQSLNTGVATIALDVGRKKFVQYFDDLGFGEETGIDLQGEIPGLVRNLEKGGDVEIATASFGQGIAMTPIETIRALAVLANDGLLPNPHIVRKIEYTTGLSKKITVTKEEMRQVFSKETTDKVTNLLVTVVDEALKGGDYKLERHSIAAKTGTAQIADKENGGYYSDR